MGRKSFKVLLNIVFIIYFYILLNKIDKDLEVNELKLKNTKNRHQKQKNKIYLAAQVTCVKVPYKGGGKILIFFRIHSILLKFLFEIKDF